MNDLSQRGKLKTTCRLYKYSPFLDNYGMMRATTRLPEDNEEYDYDRRNPAILPKNHKITQLIIMKYHESSKHSFNNSVVASLRQKYFIPNIKWTVKKTIRASLL